MKAIICRLFGHKWTENASPAGLPPGQYMQDRWCKRCGKKGIWKITITDFMDLNRSENDKNQEVKWEARK
jgi:hypothetical protein